MTFVPKIQDVKAFVAETDALIAAEKGPYQTQFGAVRFRELHAAHGQKHEWLVKNVLTRGDPAVLVGASQAGKSFLALDLAMAIVRGVDWFGNKCRQGLVVYQAGESAKGVRDKRLPAYVQSCGLNRDADLPFVLLTQPLDLFGSDDDTTKLIAECGFWRDQYPDLPFELLVIDTFSAATPGADENTGKDVGTIRRRLKRLEQALGCAVLIVHHKNAAGTRMRGHSSMFADVENVLDVSMLTVTQGKEEHPVKDARGRKVRMAKIAKLKDGTDGVEFRFTLAGVQLGTDEDGDPVTSCVIEAPDMGTVEPGEHEQVSRGKDERLPQLQYILLQAIDAAGKAEGRPAPPDVPAPRDAKVVEWKRPRDLFAAQWMGPEDAKAIANALKTCGHALVARGYIRKHNNWVWRTEKLLPVERARQERDARRAREREVTEASGEAFSENPWIGEAGDE